MTVHLLDTNVLIGLAWPQHVHHGEAHTWFRKVGSEVWSTCPITQLGFIRISSNAKIIRDAVSPRDALAVLEQIIALPGITSGPMQMRRRRQQYFHVLH